MKIKIFLISQLVALFLFPCLSQDTYQVGYSSVTLEPDDQFVSLALAGYAAPWEGRFTLQWQKQGTIPSYLGFTGSENHLYWVDGNSLLRSSRTDFSSREKICDATGISTIAADGNTLIGVGEDGMLRKIDLNRKRLRWQKLGCWDQSLHALAVGGDKLYLLDEEGVFHVADLMKRKLVWEKASFHPLKGVVSLAGDAGKLIALTSDGVLYQQGGTYQQGKWIKIGYKKRECHAKGEEPHLEANYARLLG